MSVVLPPTTPDSQVAANLGHTHQASEVQRVHPLTGGSKNQCSFGSICMVYLVLLSGKYIIQGRLITFQRHDTFRKYQ